VHNDYQKDLAVPAIIGRWDANLQAIASFNKEYSLPVLLLHWREDDVFFHTMLSRNNIKLPYIVVPNFYKHDRRWPISELDGHPTKWANNILKIGIWDRLTTLGVLPEIDMLAEEHLISAKFDAVWHDNMSRKEAIFAENIMKEVPRSFEKDDSTTYKAMLFGLVGPNMLKKGGVVLRTGSSGQQLMVELQVAIGVNTLSKHQVVFDLSFEGKSSRKTFVLKDGVNQMRLPLPVSTDSRQNKICELSWYFNTIECSGPSSCYAAQLNAVKLVH